MGLTTAGTERVRSDGRRSGKILARTDPISDTGAPGSVPGPLPRSVHLLGPLAGVRNRYGPRALFTTFSGTSLTRGGPLDSRVIGSKYVSPRLAPQCTEAAAKPTMSP